MFTLLIHNYFKQKLLFNRCPSLHFSPSVLLFFFLFLCFVEIRTGVVPRNQGVSTSHSQMRTKLPASNYQCNHRWRKIDFLYMQLQHRELNGEKNKSLQDRCRVQRERWVKIERGLITAGRLNWWTWLLQMLIYTVLSHCSLLCFCWEERSRMQSAGWRDVTMTCVVWPKKSGH